MKTIFLFTITLFFSISSFAHFGCIKGNIKDAVTGMPVFGATLTLGETILSETSDTSGNFFFSHVPAQNYILHVVLLGYKLRDVEIIVDPDDTLQLSILLTPDYLSIPEVLIHSDRPLSAASSMVLSAIDFDLRPRNSAQDMLRLVPGLFIAQHAGGGKAEQIFVRGFDCDHGTDIAIFEDGLPVNMPSHGHGQGFADTHFIIPETVQNLEIFKGPYFAQFGDFATGAAVKYETYDSLPHNTIQLEAQTIPSARALAERRALLMYQMPAFSSHTTSYAAADLMYTPGYFVVNADFTRYSLFYKIHSDLSPTSTLNLSLSSFGSNWNGAGQIPERAVTEGLITRFGSLDSTEGGDTYRNNLNLQYQDNLINRSITSQIYAYNYRFKLFSDFTFFLVDPIHGDEIEQDDNRSGVGYNGTYSLNNTLGNHSKTTFGIGFRNDNIVTQLWHVEKRVRLNVEEDANVFERSMYAYVQQEWNITPRLKVVAGLRTDYFTFDVEDLIPTDSVHTNYTGINHQTGIHPKLNVVERISDNTQLFFDAGTGFHSNDARVVVQDPSHQLPTAYGAEFGTLINPFNGAFISAALWGMDLTDELTYDGDNGEIDDNGPSRRYGIDLSLRAQLTHFLFADLDLNASRNRLVNKIFGSELPNAYYIPLAPTLTSTGGLTYRAKKFWSASLRYRYMDDRPANTTNSVVATGYTIFDFNADYSTPKYKIGLSIENLFNTVWDEAQFDTESRLYNEPAPVDQLDFTAGTPFAAKLIWAYYF